MGIKFVLLFSNSECVSLVSFSIHNKSPFANVHKDEKVNTFVEYQFNFQYSLEEKGRFLIAFRKNWERDVGYIDYSGDGITSTI